MELASKYNPADVEGKWYQYWLDHHLFSSKPDGREPYTIVIPPPNVTGVLHMGHMLNNTIQDILVRRARMEGKNACWVPGTDHGTDHASIATEAKVVNKLAAQGIKKTDLTRDEFLRHAWDWTNEHGGIILKQLRRLGASCDWDRTAFTMDEKRSKSVIKVFVDLYNKGLIYRGVRMVNWDPKALTALSDEEVIYKEEHGKFYYLRYYVADDDLSGETGDEREVIHRDATGRRYAVVATTRPETIMGDTAMCINPADPKTHWLRGKRVIVPLVGRVIPVIEDEYVDMEFGTGCLKVTPAHDVNDYMLGEKHNLPSIDIFNDNGTLSEAAGLYVGMDRFDVRRQIEKDLDAAGLLEKVEAYTNKVGFSERTNVPIEPKLSMQWFLKMQHFADMALPPVMEDKLKFYPAKYKNTYRNWLENIKDWCISRQLWWGHRIPAWYLPEGGYVVAETPEQALELARAKTGRDLALADLRQDEDCLDTWFSSWLWPISLFDGINNPGNEEIKYYYPTSDLVTGPDIIFFWVARMIMAGYEYMGDMPFRNVYFTGIVVAGQLARPAGADRQVRGRRRAHGHDALCPGRQRHPLRRGPVRARTQLLQQDMERLPPHQGLGGERRGRCARSLRPGHALVRGEAERRGSRGGRPLLEVSPERGPDGRLQTLLGRVLRLVSGDDQARLRPARQPLHLLHPFMPFITEELWQHISERQDGESLMVSPMQASMIPHATYNDELLRRFEEVKEILINIRAIRQQKGLPAKELLLLQIINNQTYIPYYPILIHLGGLSDIKEISNKSDDAIPFMVHTTEFAIPLESLIGAISIDDEIKKVNSELEHKKKMLLGIQKKLSNEKFVNNAPADVVAMERKKEQDTLNIIRSLENSLHSLYKCLK